MEEAPPPTRVRAEGEARVARPRTSSSIVSATPGAYIYRVGTAKETSGVAMVGKQAQESERTFGSIG